MDFNDFKLPHIRYMLPAYYVMNKHLYYIGNKYNNLEKFKKYELYMVKYTKSIESAREDVWLICNTKNPNNNYKDENGENIHADLSQFTDDISYWRNKKIEDILPKE